MQHHIAIIGNGITGITAARFVRKQSDHRISVISGESDHFFSRTALMYIYMGHMKFNDTKPYEDGFWQKNRIDLVRDVVGRVDPTEKRLQLASGNTLGYDRLLVASGSTPNRFGWPGQDLHGVQGLYGLPDLDAMERNTQGVEHAVVVGGGLIGVEMAEMLRSRGIGVTFLVREQAYMDYLLPREESDLIAAEIRAHGVDLRLGTELTEILADASGHARAVRTSAGDEIACRFVGLTAGVRPNIGFLDGSGIETDRGVLVDRQFATSAPDVFSAGDCAQFRDPLLGRKSIEQLWYTGRLHGKTVADGLCGTPRTYDPGVFYNSAKFFDLEYQTYGDVSADPQHSLLWTDRRRLVRIVHDGSDGAVIGFNVFGVRFRHAVCARWIDERAPVEAVLRDLRAACFDPEFAPRIEMQVAREYRTKAGQSVVPALRPFVEVAP